LLSTTALAKRIASKEATAMYLDDRDVSLDFVAQCADARPELSVERQIARTFIAFVCQRTGRSPGSAEVVRTDEGLAVTLRNRVAQAAAGRTRPCEEFQPLGELLHDLLAESSNWLHQEVGRITGRRVHSVTATVDADIGAVVVLVKQQATGSKAITSARNGARSRPTVPATNHGTTIHSAFARLTTGSRVPQLVGAGNLEVVPTMDLLSELKQSERFAMRLEVLRNLGTARLEQKRPRFVDDQRVTEANQG
jgi:hypothetical protein